MSRNSTFFPVPARCRHERPATVGGRSRRTFTEGVSRVVATASPLEAELAEPIRAEAPAWCAHRPLRSVESAAPVSEVRFMRESVGSRLSARKEERPLCPVSSLR